MLIWHHLFRFSLAICWLITLTTATLFVAVEESRANDTQTEIIPQTQSTNSSFQLSPEQVSPELLEAVFGTAISSDVFFDDTQLNFSGTTQSSPAKVSTIDKKSRVHDTQTELIPQTQPIDKSFQLSPEQVPPEVLEAVFGREILSEAMTEQTSLSTHGSAHDSIILSSEPLPATELDSIFGTQGNIEDPTAATIEPNSQSDNFQSNNNVASITDSSHELTIFPVGLNVGDRNILSTSLIKGIEAIEATTSFEQWLLPFDDVMQALSITVTVLDNGQWELRSPGFVSQLSPNELQNDADLGLVLSIQEIETRFAVPAEFDRLGYAVRFDPPWANLRNRDRNNNQAESAPIITEGLPAIQASSLGISGLSQSVSLSGGQAGQNFTARGGFSSLGTAFGGSWYLQADQTQLADASSWRLREFQYLRQTEGIDTVLGSHSTFWNSRNFTAGRYWGASYIQRWGFTPPASRSSGGFSPSQRRQAATIGRTVTGEADPSTLVQLTQGFANKIIDEVLVDSSGVYQFENVTSGQGGGSYEILLYPNGQLTAIPETRVANFSSLPGQLPLGASALILSGGTNQQSNNSFTGHFGGFRGGIAYRRGITETLTLGTGFIQDQSPQTLIEALYVPDGLPLKVAISALTDLQTADTTVNANIQFRPSQQFSLNLNSNQFSQRYNADWKVAKGLTLISRGSTRDQAISGGARFSWNTSTLSLLGNALIDSQGRLRWRLNSRMGALGIRHSGSEVTTQSELFYNLSGGRAYGDGHGLIIDYTTSNNNQLGTASWRYRSEPVRTRGRSRWDMQLGYGIGSEGNGLIASVTAPLLPGLDIRARYQGISATSDSDTFQIEFSPRLNVQSGLSLANQNQARLRTQGGLLIQPFLDENGDGVKNNDEPIYTQDMDLLVSVNNKSMSRYRPDVRRQGAFLPLPPDLYRIDLDPAGYPIDWRATETAYAVTTSAGQFTTVEIPLSRSYTIIGTVTNAEGSVLAGQRVEAIEATSGQRKVSVTNSAGIFYLEGLSQGDYQFAIGGESIDGDVFSLESSVEGLQEINFRVLPDEIQVDYFLPGLEEVFVAE